MLALPIATFDFAGKLRTFELSTHKVNRPQPPPPPPTYPGCISVTGAWGIGRMRGCHRKLWENVMEVIVKIEKTNTMTNTSERQRQECRTMKITVKFSN